MSEDPNEFVNLIHTRSGLQAQNLASLLEQAGINIRVPGANLTDGWASFMQMIGSVGADIQVPRCRLEDAKAILEEAKAAGRTLDASSEDQDPPQA